MKVLQTDGAPVRVLACLRGGTAVAFIAICTLFALEDGCRALRVQVDRLLFRKAEEAGIDVHCFC